MKDNLNDVNLTEVKVHLLAIRTWIRAISMAFFMLILIIVVYTPVKYAIAGLILFQLGSKLLTGKLNEPLLVFGKSLNIYFYQTMSYLTYNTNDKPFPFSAWPTGFNVVVVPPPRTTEAYSDQVIITPPPPRQSDD